MMFFRFLLSRVSAHGSLDKIIIIIIKLIKDHYYGDKVCGLKNSETGHKLSINSIFRIKV